VSHFILVWVNWYVLINQSWRSHSLLLLFTKWFICHKLCLWFYNIHLNSAVYLKCIMFFEMKCHSVQHIFTEERTSLWMKMDAFAVRIRILKKKKIKIVLELPSLIIPKLVVTKNCFWTQNLFIFKIFPKWEIEDNIEKSIFYEILWN
jgi:hypothetical protein